MMLKQKLKKKTRDVIWIKIRNGKSRNIIQLQVYLRRNEEKKKKKL